MSTLDPSSSSSTSSQLSTHLTDTSLNPLLSSASTSASPSQESPSHRKPSHSSQFNALTALSSAAITTYTSASRLGLGRPWRVMIETTSTSSSNSSSGHTRPGDTGPIVLHSYIRPPGQQGRSKSNGRRKHNLQLGAGDADEGTALGLGHGNGNGNGNGTALHHNDNNEHLESSRETLVNSSDNRPELSNPDPSSGDHGKPPPNGDITLLPNGLVKLRGKDKDTHPYHPSFHPPIQQEASEADDDENDEDEEGEDEDPTSTATAGGAPLLIATVVAPVRAGSAARRAASRLEGIGLEVQRRWNGVGETDEGTGPGVEGGKVRRGGEEEEEEDG